MCPRRYTVPDLMRTFGGTVLLVSPCVAGFAISTVLSLGLIACQDQVHCPSGTQRIGKPPPEDLVQWCQKRGADGIPVFHGPWRKSYSSGAIREVGSYELGQKQGAWEYFSEQGHSLVVVEFDHGVIRHQTDRRSGDTWLLVPNRGETKCKTAHVPARINGPGGEIGSGCVSASSVMLREEGPWELRRADGSLIAKGEYHEGRRQGRWEYFDEAGQQSRIEELPYLDRIVIPDPD